jgi:DNA polymerase-1
MLNRELTQLHQQVPELPDWHDLVWAGADLESSQSLLERMEIRSLKEKVRAVAAGNDGQLASPPMAATPVHSDEGNFAPLPQLTHKKVGIEEVVSSAKHEQSLTIWPVPGQLASFGITCDGYQVAIAEIANVPELLAMMSDQAITKTVFDAKEVWRRIPQTNGITFDVMLAAYLDNPGARSYELPALANTYLGISELGAGEVDLFAELDPAPVAALALLANALQQSQNGARIQKLLMQIELPTAQVLARLELRGIAVDQAALQAAKNSLAATVTAATRAAHAAAGHEFNVASPKQLQVVLFDELGLPKTKKIKTGFTTDADSLNDLLAKTGHPVLQALLQIRSASKLVATIDGLLTAVARDGRIHTTFGQSVAATGRLSSIDPNLQNIPVRTAEGRAIRAAFTPGPGYDALMTVDYSQIEMRLMAHLSQDPGLIQAFKSGEDLHNTVASEVFAVEVGAVDSEMRRQIKAMSYGLAYGLSAYGLSQQLDLTPSAATALMERYFQRFGGIRDYLAKVVNQARIDGYTETIMGRRRYLPELTSENRVAREAAERMALNSPIQGSAADLIKVAMVAVENELIKQGFKSRLLLQVHDELIFEVIDSEQEAVAELVKSLMEGAADLLLPLSVNIGVGANWDSAAH